MMRLRFNEVILESHPHHHNPSISSCFQATCMNFLCDLNSDLFCFLVFDILHIIGNFSQFLLNIFWRMTY